MNTTSFVITSSFLKFELADEVDLGDHLFSGWIMKFSTLGLGVELQFLLLMN